MKSKLTKPLTYMLLAISVVVVSIAAVTFVLLQASLPDDEGNIMMSTLSSPAKVSIDKLGIPRIQAANRTDAYQILGFVTARDRLFQMDLLRRRTAGRLAEIFGSSLVASDRWHKTMGFTSLVEDVYTRLPLAQRQVLMAYSEGVNAAMRGFQIFPFEFLLLGYSPEQWRPEDSLLVVMNMAVAMGWGVGKEDKERAATVMQAALPPSVSKFLMPRSDIFIDSLMGDSSTEQLPVEELARVMQRSQYMAGIVSDPPPQRGSNGWAVRSDKSRDGRAILASDMHLNLEVPNIWYRAELHYDDVDLYGLTLPGVPILVAGSNGRLAWSFTGSGVDVADLILIDINPNHPDQYLAPDGWRSFEERTEKIRVRGHNDISFSIRTTHWGPILTKPTLGKPVSVRWTALDPEAINLDYLEADGVSSVQEAIPLFNHAGVPTLNVLMADSQGNIAWTLTGRLPSRFGTDGITACSWGSGHCGWNGYVDMDLMPRLINPAADMLVNANQPMTVSRDLGYDFAPGYRAYRIDQLLNTKAKVTEADMLAIQLDTQAGFYRFYRDLALDVLASDSVPRTIEREELFRYLQSWDGHADPESVGLPLVVEFRRHLHDKVLSPLLSSCRSLDPEFTYRWNLADAVLQPILESRSEELLPGSGQYRDWQHFLITVLEESAQNVKKTYSTQPIEGLNWGAFDGEQRIGHLLTSILPFFKSWLDMPLRVLPGCAHCVRMARYGGATERLVVSPGHESEAILHMPGGQSGHPLSLHYRDQHQAWLEGKAIPLTAGNEVRHLNFKPVDKKLSR